METKEIRLANLLALAGRFGKAIEFCEQIGMNPSYYSQLKSGKKAIGDDTARNVERKLGIERGYMDSLHASTFFPASIIPAWMLWRPHMRSSRCRPPCAISSSD